MFPGEEHESLLYAALQALDDEQRVEWWADFASAMPALREFGERSDIGFELALKSAAVIWLEQGLRFGALWFEFAKAVGLGERCRELLDYGLGAEDPDFVDAFERLVADMDSSSDYDDGQST